LKVLICLAVASPKYKMPLAPGLSYKISSASAIMAGSGGFSACEGLSGFWVWTHIFLVKTIPTGDLDYSSRATIVEYDAQSFLISISEGSFGHKHSAQSSWQQ